jgi:hypothetical protein
MDGYEATDRYVKLIKNHLSSDGFSLKATKKKAIELDAIISFQNQLTKQNYLH